MYSQLNPAILQLTTAANFENLSVIFTKDKSLLAVNDNKKVSATWIDNDGNVMKTTIIDSYKNDKLNSITMIHLLNIQEKIFLVILSSKIIKIHSTDIGYKLVFEYDFNSDNSIVNGIEKINKELFCLSTQNKIYIFSINNNGNGFFMKDFHQDLKSKTGSFIYKFFSCGSSQFGIIENTGKITIWKLVEKNLTFSRMNSFDIHPNTKITCIRVFKSLILIGTISGQIQLVNFKEGKLLCEIQAHVKCITSLDITPVTGYLISSSEDSFVRLFKVELLNENECQVKYLQQFVAPNEMVFGAKFLNSNGSLLAISTFESDQIKLFKLN